ncbi:MAG: response regulator, partial [Candidatus Marinimicrobia bacterium]|nr:response regulator [Candidatus Neomarinimicrobiota bacterium]
ILKSGEQSDEFYADLWKTISSGKEWRGEFHNKKKNGDLFWESASISPVFDTNKKITHYIAVKEDITVQRQLEKQLQEAQRLEAVGQLAGGVAHDFNNHLAAITGYTELCLMNAEKDSQMAEDLRAILNRARKGANLVGQLLAFSRKQAVSIKAIDLNQIVEETLSFIQPLLGEDIILVQEFDGGIPDIQADPTAVDQIITNLCLNARDAMRGGGQLTISTKLVTIDEKYRKSHINASIGSYVVLSVSDSGSGMDKKTLTRIYEPFFTTKQVGEGSGLGLSIVYGLIKQHRGFIECNSELGKGTEFKIFFPLTKSAINQVELELDEKSTDVRGNETILLVEDDVDVLEIVKRGLEGRGYTVLSAENGRDALAIYKKNRNHIDIIVTDVVLPSMNGLDFSQSVHDMDPDAKILFISGYAEGILKQKFNIKKDIEILKKPFKEKEIALKIREILDG